MTEVGRGNSYSSNQQRLAAASSSLSEGTHPCVAEITCTAGPGREMGCGASHAGYADAHSDDDQPRAIGHPLDSSWRALDGEKVRRSSGSRRQSGGGRNAGAPASDRRVARQDSFRRRSTTGFEAPRSRQKVVLGSTAAADRHSVHPMHSGMVGSRPVTSEGTHRVSNVDRSFRRRQIRAAQRGPVREIGDIPKKVKRQQTSMVYNPNWRHRYVYPDEVPCDAGERSLRRHSSIDLSSESVRRMTQLAKAGSGRDSEPEADADSRRRHSAQPDGRGPPRIPPLKESGRGKSSNR